MGETRRPKGLCVTGIGKEHERLPIYDLKHCGLSTGTHMNNSTHTFRENVCVSLFIEAA